MLLSGRPLLGTELDSKLFVDRPELDRLVKALVGGLNVLVVGDRGSGKTSLLRQAARRLEDKSDTRAVYVDAARLTAATSALVAIGDALQGKQTLPGAVVSESMRTVAAQPIDQLRDETLRLVRALRVQGQTVGILDGLDPELAHALFGLLRDEMWQTGIVFVVAGDADAEAQYLTPPADAFFDLVIKLEPLRDEQQELLIARRAQDGDQDWRHLRDPKGNPRALLATLRQAQAAGVEPDVAFARRAEREAQASTLGRLHSMLLAEIENGVVASAADPELLDRLGISRQRAQQVLTRLEDAGLVQSATGVAAAGGRPRKLFWKLGSPRP